MEGDRCPGQASELEMRALAGQAMSSKVWVPRLSSELAAVQRRERYVTVILVLMLVFLAAIAFDLKYMADKLPVLLATIPLVLVISVFGITMACLFGFAAALGLLSDRPIFYVSGKSFVSLFQGIPVIVTLFLLYFGLPQLNPDLLLSPVQAGVLGLALSNGAYLAEVFRSSILAVPEGQSEAARALGMSEAQRMRRIVLPQAMRIAVPPTANYYIFILKDSALVGFIGVAELFFTARSIGQRDFKVFEMLLLAGVIYWIITIGLSAAQKRLEGRLGTAYVRDV